MKKIDLKNYKLCKPNNIEICKSSSELFVDITVEENNNFLIQCKNDKILVHNCDGDNIAALLLNFFCTYWPDLVLKGKIYRVITPLVIAEEKSNKKNKVYFYDLKVYKEFMNTNNNSLKYNSHYKKGLAALNDDESKKMIQFPELIRFKLDPEYKQTLENWFGKDTEKRKEMILKID